MVTFIQLTFYTSHATNVTQRRTNSQRRCTVWQTWVLSMVKSGVYTVSWTIQVRVSSAKQDLSNLSRPIIYRGSDGEVSPLRLHLSRDITCMKNTALSTFRDSYYINNVPFHEMSTWWTPQGLTRRITILIINPALRILPVIMVLLSVQPCQVPSHINYLEGYICRLFNSKDPVQCLARYSSYILLRTWGGLQKCVMPRQFIWHRKNT